MPPARQTKIAIVSAAIGSALLAGCTAAPITGRRQLILIPEAYEKTLGVQAYQEVLAQETLSGDQRMTGILERVGRRVAEAANRPDFEWEFSLIESEQVNAFCLPGGKVAVYTGILPVMENEAGMAVIIGHEVAHAVARHGGERLSQSLTVEVIERLVETGLRDAPPTTRTRTLQAFGVVTQVGVLLPYSRTHELEADELGLRYAARAGYDPREAVRVWQRMKAAGGARPLEFLSTHPHPDRRIEELEEQLPAALDDYGQSPQHGLGEKL
jgi:predicted Zn-dependent protease